MREVPLYNSALIKNYVDYLKKFHPDVDVGSILRHAAIASHEIEDQGHWFNQRNIDLFHEALLKATGNPSLAREVGRHFASFDVLSPIKQYVLSFMTPAKAYSLTERIASKLSRATKVVTRSLGSRKVEMTFTPVEGVKENLYQCENRMGMLESLAKIYTKKFATVEHTACMNRGDDVCRYIITWEDSPPSIMKRIRNYSALFCIALAAVTPYFLSLLPWTVFVLSLTLILLSLSWYTDHLEKKELVETIAYQGNAAARLFNKRYSEVLLVKEIGQATSAILEIDKLLTVVMEALERRLDFDRGMIMLANKEKTSLIFSVGYGYSDIDKDFLKSISFRLDNSNSRGPAVLSFKKQIPYLVNDLSEIVKDISPLSLDLVRFVGTQSFICVPIVYKGESMGVLSVDNRSTKRKLTDSDMSLLMGIAPQIAISINNALSYQQVQESEQRFRSLTENTPDIVFMIDLAGRVTYVNPITEEIIGYSADEIVGKHYSEFIIEGKLSMPEDQIDDPMNKRYVLRDITCRISHKNGSIRYFSACCASNHDAEGTVTGFLGVLRDITAQRNLENQLLQASKMEAIGTLTGGIAHDFNNVVQAISGYNQLMMLSKSSSDEEWKYLANIDKLVQRSSEMIKQLLIFCRKVEGKIEPIDLNEEIRRFCELMVRSIPKMISFEFDLMNDLSIISGDQNQLAQVVMNLTVNAEDAMPDGGTITIRTENVSVEADEYGLGEQIAPGHYVLMSFSDTGCGMDRETISHIFEPFFTTKAVGKGTGLGLSVVYGIVQDHKGYITCESQPGEGTTFSIYFPVADSVNKRNISRNIAEEASLHGRETILLVDDEVYLLDAAREMLDYYGYRTLTAEDGERAVEIFHQQKDGIDLVVLDLVMPGMGGIKCLAELLRIKPGIKVIISSGYTASLRKEDIIRKKGAASFMHKPYHLDDLVREVRKVLE